MKSSTPSSPPTSPGRSSFERAGSFRAGPPNPESIPFHVQPLVNFLKETTCYEYMPPSTRIIVLDVRLPVKEAFHAALENNISFATLWDSEAKAYVGMFTVSDFIDILLHFYKRPNVLADLEEHQIRTWRAARASTRGGSAAVSPATLLAVTPENSLFEACVLLRKHHIHRLPVIAQGALLNIMTYIPLLVYMTTKLTMRDDMFRYTLEQLGIGTYENLSVFRADSTLHDVLTTLAKRAITAVPIVDEAGVLVDVYSKTDVLYLAQAREYDLDVPVQQALRLRPKITLQTCRKTDSLGYVVETLTRTRVHRLFCVDDAFRVVGIIGVSDIFKFILAHADSPAVARSGPAPDLQFQL